MAVTSASRDLAGRARDQVEWRAWVAVLDAVNAEARDGGWSDVVPEPEVPARDRAPLLAGTTFAVAAPRLRRWIRRLLRSAAGASEAAARLAPVGRAADSQLSALLEAALAQDAARMTALAATLGVDAGALGAVGDVAPVPLLRACATRWSTRIRSEWTDGWCPVCAAWPALAEARGLERARRLRCGRCACDWQTTWLRCVYCGTDDHARLGSLVLVAATSEGAAPALARVATSIDTCVACRGYLKTVTTLTPTPAEEIALLDLATVELDLAALEQGYTRPPAAGAVAHVRVVPSPVRLTGWWRS